MNDKIFDYIFKLMVAFVFGAIIWVLFFSLPADEARNRKAKAIAEQMGCEYLGSAQGLRNVKFVDCGGEIRLIRVEME